jgi:hypothetical protein
VRSRAQPLTRLGPRDVWRNETNVGGPPLQILCFRRCRRRVSGEHLDGRLRGHNRGTITTFTRGTRGRGTGRRAGAASPLTSALTHQHWTAPLPAPLPGARRRRRLRARAVRMRQHSLCGPNALGAGAALTCGGAMPLDQSFCDHPCSRPAWLTGRPACADPPACVGSAHTRAAKRLPRGAADHQSGGGGPPLRGKHFTTILSSHGSRAFARAALRARRAAPRARYNTPIVFTPTPLPTAPLAEAMNLARAAFVHCTHSQKHQRLPPLTPEGTFLACMYPSVHPSPPRAGPARRPPTSCGAGAERGKEIDACTRRSREPAAPLG